MRIGIVTNHHLDQVGGAEEALERLATHWHAAGHAVTLFSIPSPPRRRTRSFHPPFHHVALPRLLSTRIGLKRYVRPLLRQNLDVVLACDTYWAGHVAWLHQQQTGVPYAVWSQGGDVIPGSRLLRKPVILERMKQAVAEADRVWFISSYIRDRLVELGARPQTLAHVPNGWPDEWAADAVDPGGREGRRIFAMGRLVKLKGFGTLIDAFPPVLKEHTDLCVIIAGDGKDRGGLLAQARATGAPVHERLPTGGEAGLFFPGFLDASAKRRMIDTAAVGVVPSIRQEPMSLVLFEMLCRGLPVVATDVGGNPDVVRPDVNGQLFAAEDVQALAGHLSHLLADASNRRAMSVAAAASVAAFRWSRIAERALDTLTALGRDEASAI